jgi:hypothetical protein
MNTRLLAFATLICAFLPRNSMPQSISRRQATTGRAGQSPEAMHAALQPWLRAVETLLTKTKDPELEVYARVLRNAALMVPSTEVGPYALAQSVLMPPPDTTRPWIGVLVIEAHQSLPAGRWQQLASTKDFAAEYHEDTNTIYLRSDILQIPLMRGLLVVHEMRHWWQARHPGSAKDLDSRAGKEADAYHTEFRILDELMLPGYRELLASERSRVRRLLADPKQPPIQPALNNPLLEQTFGKFTDPIAKQMAAAEIMVRAAFAEIDTAPPAIARQRETEFLRTLGYE